MESFLSHREMVKVIPERHLALPEHPLVVIKASLVALDQLLMVEVGHTAVLEHGILHMLCHLLAFLSL